MATVDGDASTVEPALRAVEGVDDIEIHGNELSIATLRGSKVIAGVAVALDGCGVPVQSLTLRTPTLDDVFLHVTGSHLEPDQISDGEEAAA